MTVGEWDHRQLCPDGACVGVIGDAGTCKVCGRAAENWGDERTRGLISAPEDAEDEDDEYDEEDEEVGEEDGEEDGEDEDEDDEEDAPDADDAQAKRAAARRDRALDPSTPSLIGEAATWSERELCPDGGCIGVIGDAGTCKVCGRAGPRGRVAAKATPEPAAPAQSDELELAADAMAAAIASDPAVAAEAADVVAAVPGEPAAAADGDPFEDRKLCGDPACVGLLGADGRCKVCGKEPS